MTEPAETWQLQIPDNPSELVEDARFIRHISCKGEGIAVRAFKVSGFINTTMQELIDSSKTEYKSRGDVCRNALYHLIMWERDHVNDPAFQAAAALALKEMAVDEYQRKIDRQVRLTETLINNHRNSDSPLDQQHWLQEMRAVLPLLTHEPSLSKLQVFVSKWT